MKEKWELIDLYPGAHIRVKMNNFYHHAIYIGNNEVIQFGLPNNFQTDPKKVKIIKSPLKDFASNEFIEVRIYNRKEQKQKNSDEEIIKIALSKIGEGDYNILHNNCEHFANYCVFGKKESRQIDKINNNIKRILKK